MGLDFRPGEAHFGYIGFHHFRKTIAKAAGIELEEMQGFKDGGIGRSWDAVSDNIAPLLNHSDCEGYLTLRQCRKVAPRLEELINICEKEDTLAPDYIVRGRKLVESMNLAISGRQRLIFC